jgi:hypothetical protein
MPTIKELIRSGRKKELWQMCCGFLDLNIEQFMGIQKRLLIEQIELLNNSKIGKKIFKGTIPQDVNEFRKRAPLTTYKDYCPELSEKQDDAMPAKPLMWQHTSGRSTEYPFNWESIKWVPVTPGMSKELAIAGTACAILSSCKEKGDASAVKKGLNFIYAVAPRPYTSGTYAYIAAEEIDCKSLPPLEVAEKLEIEDRIQLSFKQALSKGLDFYFGVAVALVTIGEKLGQKMDKIDLKAVAMEPMAALRVMKGLITSKLAGRKLMPKDLWSVKGIFSSGTDGTIFRDKIYETWGRYPLNIYASTEAGVIATQTWDYGSMTFMPSINFLEFIEESEYEHWKTDHTYTPKTVLLDEVKPGQKYEVVITNFHGAPLIRYRTGDVIKITSMANKSLGIAIPQMEFHGRVDDIIDIGAFIRLNEKVIWQAISNAGIEYVDWTARKEQIDNKSFLHVYIEPKEKILSDEIKTARDIYAELKNMDKDFLYGNVEDVLNTMPVKVTWLPNGAFEKYINLRRSQGADLAHLKPRHIAPSDHELSVLTTAAGKAAKEQKISVGAPAAS